ncbi:hypothetical protein B9Z55_015569 [Caenorhabditis nigoni]|uniref:Uncharacterized protein n=1 Tax=Caenorhabditis nigoni TaxID=1611254 RepID=A0A2G5UAS3_9PELO|nr:hypothetical protein B9Z55_015569 [Caenorhabditis nigoni]
MVVDMIISNLPTNANDSTRAGVTFNSPELDSNEFVALSITPITRINAESIVRSMELMTQSNKSPLELQKPRLEIVIKYLIPPDRKWKKKKSIHHQGRDGEQLFREGDSTELRR